MTNIGIIEFLQNQILKEELIFDDASTLLSVTNLADTGIFSDTVTAGAPTSPPYVWGPDAGNVGIWDFATYT